MSAKNVRPALGGAVQAILRPLIGILLRNGVPYGAFADIAKRVYVEVAATELALPGKKQTVSRVSTITGLTRKEVTRLQAAEAQDQNADPHRNHRPARVIGGWVRSKAYHDRKGRPADLPMDGEAKSFSSLVREFSGDIPTRAMTDELLRVGAIEILPGGSVRLLTHAYIPHGDHGEKIGILAEDVSDLIRTIDHNLTCGPEAAFFQRRVSYDNIPGELISTLKKKLARKAQSCLESLDRVLAQADRDRNSSVKGAGRVRTGVGIYYFEDEIE